MDELRIDMTRAKNALFVRQTVAIAFGLPLDQEFTWDSLRALICYAGNPRIPATISVDGLASMSLNVASEEREFSDFLKALQVARPDLRLSYRIL